MKQELKTKWIEALRSGDYAQNTSLLRNRNNEYCCLGVLCDVMKLPWERESSGNFAIRTKEYVNPNIRWFRTAALSSPMLADIGMDVEDHDTLTQMNDTDGKNFNEIADWIEENL